MILVENVLGDTLIDDGLEASLQAISQSARVLFGVHPAICFLPQSEDPARFVAVSSTHLDVYKRQRLKCSSVSRSVQSLH